MKHIVSGIKPSGEVNLGTYLGAIKNFVTLQKEHEDAHFFLFVADLHAITVKQDPQTLKKASRELAAIYLACGLKQDRLSLFIQSEIPAHAQMNYYLQCFAYMGELERMTQFKDKAQKQEAGVSSALFTYPVLMAGDILLYDADFVPVGDDQRQHLELTRDLAQRVNQRFGDIFTLPQPLIASVGARIMGLQNPTKKMSKSDVNPKDVVLMLDPPNIIEKRIKSAVTDSEGILAYSPSDKPGISNLITIEAALLGTTVEAIVEQHQGETYATYKEKLAQLVIDHLTPIQERYQILINSSELDDILDAGAAFAGSLATKKAQTFARRLGLGRSIKKTR